MTAIQQAEQLLGEMTQTQKFQFLQLLARDLSGVTPGIISTPEVCGGEPRVEGTRIPVWVLVQYRKLGATEADLLGMYPTLRSEDLVNAWAYYRTHQTDIEQQIVENETA
ncbi:MAG: DUF433 domain-containing protein [Chloroflexi bacterium]|nr:DUF433 domain-containing protein [Chloroflexota bacterium]